METRPEPRSRSMGRVKSMCGKNFVDKLSEGSRNHAQAYSRFPVEAHAAAERASLHHVSGRANQWVALYGLSLYPQIYTAGYRYTGSADFQNLDAFVVK